MWLKYEQRKKIIRGLNLSDHDYENRIKELVKELEDYADECISSTKRKIASR